MEYENTWLYPGVLWAKTEDSVLDLCCGTGDLTFLMSEKVGSYGKVTGFDFSKEQLSIASSRHYLFSKGKNWRNWPYMQGYFLCETL
ncbi:2-phytyl-1,4-beta-naphthoquinone methyltransferase, chloroplastic-like isoform X3 [Durio zibethinus]|uniref:2-phytyl-1,4-beta-naphthoquinone methyltransferase, chloroplastic-like isoform X3 n=1 Tax=Durio zibethinus TaxID=66656 RepID=A0A6P5XZ13_DURZI|nr:2-phytyl-1,4-beta-naphthoquinone methyltransferase, chloroplastic-like isoform X3 [Durio zibethinus]